MPRKYFMDQTGSTPEKVFRTVAYSGSHDVVMQMVANGTHQVGALKYASWDKASDELKDGAPIIQNTLSYTDYALTARTNLGKELTGTVGPAVLEGDGRPEKGARNGR